MSNRGQGIYGISRESRNRFRYDHIDAANRLYGDIVTHHKANPNDPIRLIAHSHGGNVAILAANLLANAGIKVDTLITIATPVRDDYQLTTSVGQHLHVYNTGDWVQTGGGNDGNLYWCAFLGAIYSSAGRTFAIPKENNIEVPVTGFDPTGHHSSMHANRDIWDKYIKDKIIK